MNLRMLKEAQLASTLDKSELALLESVKVALGKESVCDLLESFRPTADQYAEWLAAVVGQAEDDGVSISKRDLFYNACGNMFENDPEPPPYEMQELVMKKLWQDYQSAKHAVRIDKAGQAAQEEEEESQRLAFGKRDWDAESEMRPGDAYLQYRAKGGKLSREQWSFDRDQRNPWDDEEDEELGDIGSIGAGVPNELDPDQDSISSDDVPAGAEVEADTGAVDSAAELKAIIQRVLDNTPVEGEQSDLPKGDGDNDEDDLPPAGDEMSVDENEETSVMSAKTGDSVKPKTPKTFLQQMLSGPRDNLNQALKDVEAEGESAWKAHQMPDNPHPKKSMAHKAWERGMKKAVKGHFGFDEKPPVVTSKQRRK